MTAAPAKFTFDLDLGRTHDHPVLLSEGAATALQQQARADGYAEGFAAGEHSASSAAAQSIAASVNALAERAAAMLEAIDKSRAAVRQEAVGLAAAIGRKLATALLAQHPEAELEALLVDCLGTLEGVPHLVIRCHPDLADRLRELATARIAMSGFSGRLIVMGDPEIAVGDGRIEWADGGLVRDMAKLSAGIDERIAAYLAAAGAEPIEETH